MVLGGGGGAAAGCGGVDGVLCESAFGSVQEGDDFPGVPTYFINEALYNLTPWQHLINQMGHY